MSDVNAALTDARAHHEQRWAMRISLLVGFFMLAGKTAAYVLTGSAAILSDAAESVVHVVAVSFAAYSLRTSFRPADSSHPYGYEKISFFSAGFEGGMIVVVAFYIIFEAVRKWILGLELGNLGVGVVIVAAAAVLNGFLGWYLVAVGRRRKSLILEANGKHVLTDCWTSLGVILALMLVLWTGWKPFDPLLAIFVALNILGSGGVLVRRSVRGLMDEGDPSTERVLRALLRRRTEEAGIAFHGLRHRESGQTVWVEFHLLFPRGTVLEAAHALATEIEEEIEHALPVPVEIISHLETLEDHAELHKKTHYEERPGGANCTGRQGRN